MHVLHVVGARPNFMKVAPVHAEFRGRSQVRQTLVHTGQHYDANLSDIFFEQLQIPRPDVSLEVGSGSHAVQTAEIMIRFEKTILERQPDLVLVYGDVNSTVAATLVCAKIGTKIAHVEAGLRSFDRTMPEEINRLVTDQLADLLLIPSEEAEGNLLREGVAREKIHFVGNVMIDTLRTLLPQARMPQVTGLGDRYALVTLHRPSNVDEPESLRRILETLTTISESMQIVFPVHPRTKARIESLGYRFENSDRIFAIPPTGYLECLALQQRATVVVTDSGGLQEETTALGVPCLTVRENTERPITITHGTNTLVGTDMNMLLDEVSKVLAGQGKGGRIPPLWDGRASKRIADIVLGVEAQTVRRAA
ncbi:non-hydrolyzing UDP-N-acetylglucosamine 2-epimerase [Schlesneria paludicola]|uniref:non-hydrolyzing UDP-N-acetylglucosamine 2-epimerase n=1 Tax=Schlesneria paludicola TaxID=360056 RepID=UPI00029B1174|nr:UDP-N-acetylglucosamine 2-epimerase (non-hydrolyzing) [Schlesneria paludicola]